MGKYYSVIIKEIKLNTDIEDLYNHFSKDDNTSFLNSCLQKDVGRYSIIGIEPYLVINHKNKFLEETYNNQKNILKINPLNHIENLLKKYKVKNKTNLPFIAGGIGYFGYELKNLLEKLPQTTKDDLKIPDLYFVFYNSILIYDRLIKKAHLSCVDLESNNKKLIEKRISELKNEINGIKKSHNIKKNKTKKYKIKLNIPKKEYIDAIDKIKRYIKRGHIYQSNFSQRFESDWNHNPYELFMRLNKLNPVPFSAYLNFKGFKIISSSPERFIKVNNQEIEARPIKGTRPRGKNREEDEKFKRELLKSRKDQAELYMIIDLERNDLSKICIPGSVIVKGSKVLESYSSVHHTVGIVEGKIKQDISLIDCIRAMFPGGSITGCPKIRCMEILDELEKNNRSIYTGSIGYLSFHNTMDLNIAIRTFIYKNKKVYFQVGGGIVIDSKPEEEYLETFDKAKALIKSINPD